MLKTFTQHCFNQNDTSSVILEKEIAESIL